MHNVVYVSEKGKIIPISKDHEEEILGEEIQKKFQQVPRIIKHFKELKPTELSNTFKHVR